MSKILILGAGMVAGPLVEYLHHCSHRITLASVPVAEAQKMAQGRDGITPCSIDVTDETTLAGAVAAHDIVVSFIPFQLHPRVARQCIVARVPMVTASYCSDEMHALDADARDAGVLLLNEVGFDPGLDHLSAMKIIDKVHVQGGKIKAFVSWGTGLPAPEANDNPFGYKFAWAPKGVLQALNNTARFLNKGRVIEYSPSELLQNRMPVWTGEPFMLEGYPNRDSMPYRKAYGLKDVDTVMRGTLRYTGNLAIMDDARELGLLSEQPCPAGIDNWRDLLATLTGIAEHQLESDWPYATETLDAFAWLGLLDAECKLPDRATLIDVYCEALQAKLQFAEGERDMAMLLHKFVVEDAAGRVRCLSSKFKIFASPGGHSAMSKAVGTPAAIAVQLILEGKIDQVGAQIPVKRCYYEQMLPRLSEAGLACDESEVELSAKEFLRELN